MKKILSTIPAALSVVFLAGAFSPAQAVPMSVAKGVTDNISTSAITATKVGKRGRKYHRGHRYRNRGYRNRGYRRGYYRRGFDLSIGFGSYYPSYYYGGSPFYSPYSNYGYDFGYGYGPSYYYDPGYAYDGGYEYDRGYQYRGDSKTSDEIFKQLEPDGN